MGDLRPLGSERPAESSFRDLGPRFQRLAELGLAATDAKACLLDWSTSIDSGEVRSPSSSAAGDSITRSAIELFDQKRDFSAEFEERFLSRRELANIESSRTGLVWAAEFSDAQLQVRVALVASAERPPEEVKASLSIIGRTALACLAARDFIRSRDFWRERASALGAKWAHETEASQARELRRKQLDTELATLSQLVARNRYEHLGRSLARLFAADKWSIVEARGRTPEVLASWRDGDRSISDELLAQCASARKPLVSSYQEQGTSLLLPFDGGVVWLARETQVTSDEIASIQSFVERVGLLIRAWRAEDELTRQRSLVQHLSLRMFTAVDQERARIARDLHDDQAQLLAAAKLALEGQREGAREVFRKLADELRRRTRALRPISLVDRDLLDAVGRECERLRSAGVEVNVASQETLAQMPNQFRTLCYQVVREAVANIIRHSDATHAELEFEQSGGLVRIRIADDGRGWDPASAAEGSGLRGLRERIELLGGRLTTESRPGATCLRVEIPEPA